MAVLTYIGEPENVIEAGEKNELALQQAKKFPMTHWASSLARFRNKWFTIFKTNTDQNLKGSCFLNSLVIF